MYSPFFTFVVFFMIGIVCYQFWMWPFVLLAGLLAFSILAAGILVNKPKLCLGLLFISFFLSGIIYAKNFETISFDDISRIGRYYAKEPVSLEGVIVSDVEKRDFFKTQKTSFTLEVRDFKTKWGWKKKRGKVLVNVFQDADLKYGDYIFIEGKLHRPFNFQPHSKFSYPRYLRYRGVHFILSVGKDRTIRVLDPGHGDPIEDLAFKARDKFRDMLVRTLSKKESGMMRALILGERTSLDDQINELFIRTGTAHVIAISGLHITIVSVMFFMFLKLLPVGRKNQYLLAIALLVFYTFLTGCRPSVVRASIMAIVFLLSFLLEKETQSLNSLSLSAFLILLLNPFFLYDIGFQLSFVSVLFIIRLFPWWNTWIAQFVKEDAKVLHFLTQSLGISLVAWLGVVGLILYNFEILTPVSILANLVIVPLSSLTIILGMGLITLGPIHQVLAVCFAACVKFALNLMVILTFVFDRFPASCFYFKDVPLWLVVLYYAVLGALFWVFKHRKEEKAGL